MAECLEVNLTVEHLLPCLEIILVDEAGDQDPDRLQHYYKIIFGQLDKLIQILSTSEFAAGQEGIKTHLMPLYASLFRSDDIEEVTRKDI
jgi:hypothetical protein